MLDPLEDLNEMGGIFKAAVAADRLNGIPVSQHQTGMGHPDAVQIIHIGHSGQGLEPATEMVFAVAGQIRHFFNGDLPGVVFVGPADQILQAGAFEPGMGKGTAPILIHMPGKEQEQLQNQRQAPHQIPVIGHKAPDNVQSPVILRAEVLQLAQLAVMDGQVICHIDVVVHLVKADFEDIHGAAPRADVVGMDGIGRNYKQLLPAQAVMLVVNHNFTT